jgi:hypothetical protein
MRFHLWKKTGFTRTVKSGHLSNEVQCKHCGAHTVELLLAHDIWNDPIWDHVTQTVVPKDCDESIVQDIMDK